MYQYLKNKESGNEGQKFNLQGEKEFTIGRTSQNTLQILDSTISKKHARIIPLKGNTHSVIDLDSANGILINGQKLDGKKILQNGDILQFGKYQCLYQYVDKINSKNADRLEHRENKSRGKSRGRINLKDYMFEGEAKFENEKNPVKLDEPKNLKSQTHYEQDSMITQPKKGKKNKVKEGRIKIPDLSEYLKIEDQSKIQVETKAIKFGNLESKIKMQAQDQRLDVDEEKRFELFQREKNLFKQEQEALQQIQSKKKETEQKKLRLEVEQARKSEDLIQKQMFIEKKKKTSRGGMEKQRQRLQNEMILAEEKKRMEEMRRIEEMEIKQKQMLTKLEEERGKQLADLAQKESLIKNSYETEYRSQYEKRKKELQIEAEALARQYQNIYRQTIKKVRTEIDNEEATVQEMEKKYSILENQNEKLQKNIENLREGIDRHKRDFITLSGRNKACILYASEIQDRIDGLGDHKKGEEKGYYKQTSKQNGPNKIKSSISNSRKLLKIKKKEHQNIFQEITLLCGIAKENAYPVSTDVCDYLETIIQNAHTIECLKDEYLELVEGEKAVEDQWDIDLRENQQLSEKERVLESEIKKNTREIDQNTRDQIKKSTEQRLHMLKLMHYCEEEKKEAAKFLIEEMVNIGQEIHSYTLQNQTNHSEIASIITKSEQLKRDNEYISEILFGQEENCHHFDNMKAVINTLLSKIEEEVQINSPLSCLTAARNGMNMQLKIQDEIERKKEIKDSMRKISTMGIAGKNSSSERNPLIFFGDLLTKKQLEEENRKRIIFNLEKEVKSLKEELKMLEGRKQKTSSVMQKFKREQLMEAKKYLLK